MVLRIALEIQGYVVELGTDGRLLSLQLAELLAGVGEERSLVLRDYAMGRGRRVERAAAALDILDGARLLDLVTVAQALGCSQDRREVLCDADVAGEQDVEALL